MGSPISYLTGVAPFLRWLLPCLVGQPDLAIGPGDVRYLPAFPRAGDRVAVALTIHNRGTQDARGVLVRYGIAGADHDSTGIDVRRGDSVVIRWRVDLVRPGPWRLVVAAVHPADRQPSNNETTVTLGITRRRP